MSKKIVVLSICLLFVVPALLDLRLSVNLAWFQHGLHMASDHVMVFVSVLNDQELMT